MWCRDAMMMFSLLQSRSLLWSFWTKTGSCGVFRQKLALVKFLDENMASTDFASVGAAVSAGKVRIKRFKTRLITF